jgi:dihydrofolate synthase/folylpolyglutamate synthase
MNYQQTIDYLYNTLPMFSRMGSAAFKKDLTNTLLLCERLDNPENKFKSIHVAGTNGKGSVSHMLAAIFQTAGYKTGLYTSPHLYDFRERIKINGEMAEKNFVSDFVDRIRPAIDEIQPSFFEITVAMAFDYFAKQKVDVAIVEVGLGGRLDSTNVIYPMLSVITNIGWDHMNLLGNSLEEIAREKAGIIKEKVPVVIGETSPELKKIFDEMAQAKNAPVHYASSCFKDTGYTLQEDRLLAVYEGIDHVQVNVETDLAGIYQVRNIMTVLTTIPILRHYGWKLSDRDIESALKQVKKLTGLHGRWEVIHRKPTVVLEVAHNEDGIRQMLFHLENISFNKLHIVIGMVKDKEIDKALKLMPATADYYFTQAQIPRAMDAETLRKMGAAYGLNGNSFKEVNEGLQQAMSKASDDDLIIVCGSIFLVADVDRQSITQLA